MVLHQHEKIKKLRIQNVGCVSFITKFAKKGFIEVIFEQSSFYWWIRVVHAAINFWLVYPAAFSSIRRRCP